MSTPSQSTTGKDVNNVHAHLHRAHAALPCFHPTRAHGTLDASAGGDEDTDVEWHSRASRKRIYAPKAVSITHVQRDVAEVEHKVHDGINRLIAEMRVHRKGQQDWFTRGVHFCFVGDVSFWVAFMFVLGSTAWIINGFLLFMPLVSSAKQYETQAAGWAFVGGTLFEIGSYLMLVESLNTGHGQLFGRSLESLLEGGSHADELVKSPDGETFHWMGTRSWRDLGYLASSVQMAAAAIFWISTITGLPGVIPGFPASSNKAITDVFFWTPQILGGSGFIISSTLLMLEVQTRWWKFAVSSIGWHIAAWNLVGGVGFTLCGAFGYGSVSASWLNYQSVLCTFWGSWAFMIGSGLQLVETLMRE